MLVPLKYYIKINDRTVEYDDWYCIAGLSSIKPWYVEANGMISALLRSKDK